MRDELPDWMDPPAEDADRPRRRLHRLVALAVVPWVVVAVLVGWRGDGEAVDATRRLGDAAVAAEPPEDRPEHHPEDEPDDEPVEQPSPEANGDTLVAETWQGGWREFPGDGATVAVAAAVARAWLTGLAPVLDVAGVTPDDATGYAEHLTVEAIERPGPGAAVVTFSAVVLDGGDPATARLRRVAVPVDERAVDPRPAGAPWELKGLDLTPTAPDVADELGDEHWPAAEAALRAGGFVDAELHGLQRTTAWPVLAAISTPTPDGPRHQVVWLRRHLDRFVVAGLPLTQALPAAEEQP
ncbi:MAG: hypothetical protein KG028_14310 [Actinobacteria bacterium]|jgi:hypothetical protein|nr:hypothetical protein [Actinomycetota bacterium]